MIFFDLKNKLLSRTLSLVFCALFTYVLLNLISYLFFDPEVLDVISSWPAEKREVYFPLFSQAYFFIIFFGFAAFFKQGFVSKKS